MKGVTTILVNAVRKLMLVMSTAGVGVTIPMLVGLLMAHTGHAQTPSTALTPADLVSLKQQIAQRRLEQAQQRTVVAFDPENFEKYEGHYQITDAGTPMFLNVFRNGQNYFAQVTVGHPVQIYPESATKFFATTVAAQLSFESDANGQVVAAVLHQNGFERRCPKVDGVTVANALAALKQRLQSNQPSPGTQTALSAFISSLQSGQPAYGSMEPNLIVQSADQMPLTLTTFKKLGALVSLQFKGIGPSGADIYLATFVGGQIEYRVAPLASDGKIVALSYRVLDPTS